MFGGLRSVMFAMRRLRPTMFGRQQRMISNYLFRAFGNCWSTPNGRELPGCERHGVSGLAKGRGRAGSRGWAARLGHQVGRGLLRGKLRDDRLRGAQGRSQG